ncbi:hypothetical protein BXY64_1513 [Marinifilum flexuosum]|uniref:Uncharacterized protein n=1 Tax=Marinifilum flexuosum TaxID=1117708 RepID=A0A419X9Q0_9BACT|nr:hypothetical protein BXY64_1513 [Marinifilum flexuosum]
MNFLDYGLLAKINSINNQVKREFMKIIVFY